MSLLPLHTSTGFWPDLSEVWWVPVVIGAAGFAYGLAFARQSGRGGQATTLRHARDYFLGLFAMGIALLGPPEALADDLFSAHMVQHLLLVLVGPPLILRGRPFQTVVRAVPPRVSAETIGSVLRPRLGRLIARAAGHPVTAFVALNGALVLWHLPEAYDKALANEWVHTAEHATFVLGAVLFWRLIIDPMPAHHRASPHAVIGLAFATCMVGNIVAAAITLSPQLLYAGYGPARPWGIEPLLDQQVGGLIMWLSGAVYFALIFVVLAREAASTTVIEAEATRS